MTKGAFLILSALLAPTPFPMTAAAAPPPVRTTLAALQTNEFGKCRIQVEGTIIGVFPGESTAGHAFLVLRDGANTICLTTRQKFPSRRLLELTGAQVSAVGVFSPARRCRMIRKYLLLDSPDDITILSKESPTPMRLEELTSQAVFNDRIMQTRTQADGTVLAVWGENNILIRSDEGLLVRGELSEPTPPPFGSQIRLVGYPETDLYNVILVRASWTALATNACVKTAAAKRISAKRLSIGRSGFSRNSDFRYHGKAVELTGVVRGLPVEGGDGRIYLESDGQMVTVDVGRTPTALEGLEVGCTITAAGTCVVDTEKMGFNRAFPRVTGARIVVRTPDDIRLLARPPWWTVARLTAALGILLAAGFGIVFWNLILRRAVAQRSNELETEIAARIGSDLKVYERTRLAVELHDSLSQYLTGVAMQVRTAEIVAKSDPSSIGSHLSLADKAIDACRDELRNCLWDLRNLTLDEADIDAAIRKTLAPHLETTDLAVRFAVPRERLSDNTTHAILNIIRELTVNAVRHGHATSVRVAGSIAGDRLLFSVRDNGCGFVPEDAPGMVQGHFGLQGIRDRIKAFAGETTIDSAPGRGTKVTIALRIPTVEVEETV